MIFGYARVSTREQNLELQLDALQAAGCRRIFQERVGGARAERPELAKLMDQVREGDVIVIWKLDRLGRSMGHLVGLVSALQEKGVGLKSLNDPIDTTSPQGRLVFNLFASLAEFERDLIRERTQAGLQAARARGRKGGRPKGLSAAALRKAVAAEALYRAGKLTVNEIAQNLHISKATLYTYLRHQGVEIGTVSKPTKTIMVRLWLRVENNNKYVRGKKRAREEIEQFVLRPFAMRKLDPSEYELTIEYESEEELDRIIYRDILGEAASQADQRHCFIESDVREVGTERSW